MTEQPEQPSAIKQVQESIEHAPLRYLLGTVIALLAIGTTFYHVVEGWTWLDSFYFCAITLTTIGYGDFSPKTDPGKLFTVFYAFLGIGVLATFISVSARNRMSKRYEAQEKKRLQEKVSEISTLRVGKGKDKKDAGG